MMSMGMPDENLSDDLLEGADAIAAYLYGSPEKRRKVYHLSRSSKIPLFRLGSMLCARRSRLKAWIKEQEDRNWRGDNDDDE